VGDVELARQGLAVGLGHAPDLLGHLVEDDPLGRRDVALQLELLDALLLFLGQADVLAAQQAGGRGRVLQGQPEAVAGRGQVLAGGDREVLGRQDGLVVNAAGGLDVRELQENVGAAAHDVLVDPGELEAGSGQVVDVDGRDPGGPAGGGELGAGERGLLLGGLELGDAFAGEAHGGVADEDSGDGLGGAGHHGRQAVVDDLLGVGPELATLAPQGDEYVPEGVV